ncbi:MAG: hypothetical protein Q7U13_01720, partial [Rhodoferax sp.]|nr:hypothetical protein [Rhodoferax sp.]
ITLHQGRKVLKRGGHSQRQIHMNILPEEFKTGAVQRGPVPPGSGERSLICYQLNSFLRNSCEG